MDSAEARSILATHRAGSESDDPRFEQARAQAETDAELARWWEEDQTLDRIIAAKLDQTDIPAGLKKRVLSFASPARPREIHWLRPTLIAAASIVALALIFGFGRARFQSGTLLADYRDEMVSFVKVDPTLEMETNDLSRVTAFLQKSGAPSPGELPGTLGGMPPVGCRTLRFRGHDVSLICFKGSGGKLLHMFVVNRAALPALRPDMPARYAAQGSWETVMWVKGDQAYLVMLRGDHAELEKYILNS